MRFVVVLVVSECEDMALCPMASSLSLCPFLFQTASSPQTIFSVLGLECTDHDEEELDRLFGVATVQRGGASTFHFAVDSASSLLRIKMVHRLYVRWNRMNRKKETKNGSFYDALNIGLGPNYDLNRFLSDFRAVTEHNELLLREEELNENGDGDEDMDCDAAHCLVLRRSLRDRSKGQSVAEWFSVADGDGDGQREEDDEVMPMDKIKEMSCLEMMDSVHCHLVHTIRLSPRQIAAKQNEEGDKKKDDGHDEEDECFDPLTAAISSLIEGKQQLSRFRDSSRFSSAYNKFVTVDERDDAQTASVSTADAVVDDHKVEGAGNGGNDHSNLVETTFIDAVQAQLDELVEEEPFCGVDQKGVSSFSSFIEHGAFDSDAVREDLEDRKDSNILEAVCSVDGHSAKRKEAATNSIHSVTSRFISRCNRGANSYSPGFRYFYWKHYKDRSEEERVVFQGRTRPIIESNPGYKLSEWYVEPKYANLKEEALQNECARIPYHQYLVTLNKAEMKLREWQSSSKARVCNHGSTDSMWLESYGLADGSPVGVDHIVALLFYCNFTKQSYEFSRTFRRTSLFESDRSLKRRHREFAVWGKKLREIVECWGYTMAEPDREDITEFYHGVSASMLFDSTSIRLCGPVSTTLGLHSLKCFLCFAFVDSCIYILPPWRRVFQ